MLGRLARLRPASLWKQIRDDLVDITDGLPQGDVTDFCNFMGAVIDERAFAKHTAAIERARPTRRSRSSPAGPTTTRSGYFVRPTVLESGDPTDESFRDEYFGPILTVHVYPDARYERGAGPAGQLRAVRA